MGRNAVSVLFGVVVVFGFGRGSVVEFGVQARDLAADQLIRQGPGGRRPALRSPITPGRVEIPPRLPAWCGRRARPRSDPSSHLSTSMKAIISTRGGRARWQKNTLADRRISFAFSSSTICFLGRVIFTCASEVVPGSRPASTSACFFNNRNVSGLTPSRPAT